MFKEKTVMNYSIQINNSTKVINCKHEGVLSIDDIITAWNEILGLDEFKYNGYNLISDYTEAEFEFGIEETEKIDKYLDSIKYITKGKKSAVVVDDPKSIVLPLIYQKKAEKELDFYLRTFTTYEAAKLFVSAY